MIRQLVKSTEPEIDTERSLGDSVGYRNYAELRVPNIRDSLRAERHTKVHTEDG